MIKKIVLACSFMFATSFALASEVPSKPKIVKSPVTNNQLYEYKVKTKSGSLKVDVKSVLNNEAPFGTTYLDSNKDCMVLNTKGKTVTLNTSTKSGVSAVLIPVEVIGSKVKTIIVYEETKYKSKEQKIKVSEKCAIANSVTTTTSVRFVQDLTLGKQATIKLPDNDELYVTVNKAPITKKK